MKVLLPASEVAPIIKLGGLGDVVGSLPKALSKLDVDVDVIVPFFPIAKIQGLNLYKQFEMQVPFKDAVFKVDVYKTKLPHSDVDVLLLKNDHFFGHGGKSAFRNNISETEMFSFFDKSVVEYIKSCFNTYDLVHCNDWHTGLITHLLESELVDSRPATLFTIHNLAYQGVGSPEIVRELGIYPGEHQLIDWDIADGDINFMLQGVTSSDYISTVSPTYAKEILLLKEQGQVESALVARSSRLSGILNGIDYSQFNVDYDSATWKSAKSDYKKELQTELGLKIDSKSPIYCFISRLDPNQKGLDILEEVIPYIVEKGGQFVLLGTGDPAWEGKFRDLQEKYKGFVSSNILFSVDVAEKIYKGSDFILIPSRYEPCGLTQMIGMHYGTLPIAHAVGGLEDSIEDGVDGFKFKSYSADDFTNSIDASLKIYSSATRLTQLVKNAMNKDFSWDSSAVKYKKLYGDVMKSRKE